MFRKVEERGEVPEDRVGGLCALFKNPYMFRQTAALSFCLVHVTDKMLAWHHIGHHAIETVPKLSSLRFCQQRYLQATH